MLFSLLWFFLQHSQINKVGRGAGGETIHAAPRKARRGDSLTLSCLFFLELGFEERAVWFLDVQLFRPTTVLKKWLNIGAKDSDDFSADEGDVDSVYDDDGDEEGSFLLLVLVGILE